MSFVHFDEIFELCCEEIDGSKWGRIEDKPSRQAETVPGAWNGQARPLAGNRKKLIVATRPHFKAITLTP